MPIKYLMDENVAPIYQQQLRRKEPDLVVWAIGETLEELVLAALVYVEGEYADIISYLLLP